MPLIFTQRMPYFIFLSSAGRGLDPGVASGPAFFNSFVRCSLVTLQLLEKKNKTYKLPVLDSKHTVHDARTLSHFYLNRSRVFCRPVAGRGVILVEGRTAPTVLV